jgi:tripartite-type tricarboxylate transporter receptor subunit TctC
MKPTIYVKSAVLAAMIGASLAGANARAAGVEDFFKGRQVTMYIGSEPGAGYDLYGRTVARFIGRHIPGNPTVIPSNMPGAGSIVLANFMYAKAPRDGTAMAGVQNGDVMEPILGNQNARFTPSEFTWLGSVNQQTNVCVSWTATGIKTGFDAQKQELLLGVVTSTSTETVANLMNELAGTKFKLIKGYKSTGAVLQAMEQGEVGGLCGIGIDSVQSSMTSALTSGRITVFAQVGPEKHPDLPDATFVYDMLKNPADKSLLDFLVGRMLFGRPFMAPPGVPEDRAKALREAFVATMKDPEFIAEAKKLNMPVLPIDGWQNQDAVKKLESASPELIQRASKVLGMAK